MWIFVFWLSMAIASGSAAAFDCSGVTFPPTVVLCSDPELTRLADERQAAINEARARIGEQAWPALWEDQKDWVRSYAAACGVPPDRPPPNPVPASVKECFRRAGEARVAYLRAYGVSTSRASPAIAAEITPNGRIGPSFDCSKATSPLTVLICGDAELSRLDLSFNQAYWALFQQVGVAGQSRLKEEDIAFIGQVQSECGLSTSGQFAADAKQSRDCVEVAYQRKRADWVAQLTGPALEEATRAPADHVKLQRDLQQVGFLPPGPADGVYGRGTRAAIIAWQSARSRASTGLLGETDAAALEQEVSTSEGDGSNTGVANVPARAVDCALVAKKDADYSAQEIEAVAHQADMMLDNAVAPHAGMMLDFCPEMLDDIQKIVEFLGDHYVRSGQFAAAETLYRKVLRVLEPPRRDLADFGWGNLWGHGRDERLIYVFMDIYPALIDVLEKGGKFEEALISADRDRAVELYESFWKGYGGRVKPDLTVQSLRALAHKKHATFLFYQLVSCDDPCPSEHRFISTQGSNSLKSTVRIDIWVVQPNGAIIFRQSDPRSDSIRVSQSAVPETFQVIREVRGLEAPASPQTAAVDEELRRYYRLLIEPVETYLPKNPQEEIIIVPDRDILLVPFYALSAPNGKKFIDLHTISFAPSLRILNILENEALSALPVDWSHMAQQDALVIGNPTMPRLPGPNDPCNFNVTFQLRTLSGAEDEARAVAAVLHTEPILGSDANESAVFKGLQNARVAHFATHGLPWQEPSVFVSGECSVSMSEDWPYQGALAIAPDPGERVEDRLGHALARGFLYSGNLSATNIKTELVVLSACDTGTDGSVTAFSHLGLPEAFLVAGARNVLMTLWTVSDDATENLMVQFYRNLQHGLGISQSLRQAMLITKRDFENIREWSAFMLIGAGR
jgi:CHAT domain-containing protein/uncharacterized protein